MYHAIVPWNLTLCTTAREGHCSAGHGGLLVAVANDQSLFTKKKFTSETYTMQLNNKLSANNNQTIG